MNCAHTVSGMLIFSIETTLTEDKVVRCEVATFLVATRPLIEVNDNYTSKGSFWPTAARY